MSLARSCCGWGKSTSMNKAGFSVEKVQADEYMLDNYLEPFYGNAVVIEHVSQISKRKRKRLMDQASIYFSGTSLKLE
jgi:hypothetical protein